MPRKYEMQLRQAFEEAPIWESPDAFPAVDERYQALQSMPDQETIYWNPGERMYEPNPGEVHVSDIKALFELMSECVRLVPEYADGLDMRQKYPMEEQMTGIVHEGEHRTAAQMLGAAEGIFGLSIRRTADSDTSQGYFYSFGPFYKFVNLFAPKLAVAAFLAYPNDPSQGDRLQLSAFGYDDLEDLDRRIVRYNKAHSDLQIPRIPRPLSVKSD